MSGANHSGVSGSVSMTAESAQTQSRPHPFICRVAAEILRPYAAGCCGVQDKSSGGPVAGSAGSEMDLYGGRGAERDRYRTACDTLSVSAGFARDVRLEYILYRNGCFV